MHHAVAIPLRFNARCGGNSQRIKRRCASQWLAHRNRNVESDCDQAARRRRRRASATSPPQAASNPGRPAPTIGPGTATLIVAFDGSRAAAHHIINGCHRIGIAAEGNIRLSSSGPRSREGMTAEGRHVGEHAVGGIIEGLQRQRGDGAGQGVRRQRADKRCRAGQRGRDTGIRNPDKNLSPSRARHVDGIAVEQCRKSQRRADEPAGFVEKFVPPIAPMKPAAPMPVASCVTGPPRLLDQPMLIVSALAPLMVVASPVAAARTRPNLVTKAP